MLFVIGKSCRYSIKAGRAKSSKSIFDRYINEHTVLVNVILIEFQK